MVSLRDTGLDPTGRGTAHMGGVREPAHLGQGNRPVLDSVGGAGIAFPLWGEADKLRFLPHRGRRGRGESDANVSPLGTQMGQRRLAAIPPIGAPTDLRDSG